MYYLVCTPKRKLGLNYIYLSFKSIEIILLNSDNINIGRGEHSVGTNFFVQAGARKQMKGSKNFFRIYRTVVFLVFRLK